MKYMDGLVLYVWLYVFYDQDNYEDVFFLVGVYILNFDKNKEFGFIINYQGLFYGIYFFVVFYLKYRSILYYFLGFCCFFILNIF